jgi:hypothetical protein
MKVDINNNDGERILLETLHILAEIDIKAGRPILAFNAVDRTNRPDYNLIEHIKYDLRIDKDAFGNSISLYYPIDANFYQYWKNKEPYFV